MPAGAPAQEPLEGRGRALARRPHDEGPREAPTGKAYRIPMATFCHWGKDGIMFEEYLFWDNGEFMKQIGLAQ